MEKLIVIDEMDLDEWEVLSDDGFHEEVGKSLIVSSNLDFNPKGVFDMDYFGSFDAKQVEVVLPRTIHLDTKCFDEEVVKEVIKAPILEQDIVSQQISFKKEIEFVDIKMDSPKSSSRGVKAQIEAESIRFEEEKKDVGIGKEDFVVEKKEIIRWEKSGGLNIWKWRVTGIGALCSIGMAAATICIFILGSQQRHKHQQQNQKLRFQIYADDNKRFKQVVHQATKLNQAISSVRTGPFNNAHFTYGGYYVYDGL